MQFFNQKWMLALATAVVIWIVLAVVREQLIPFHASGEQRTLLLTGDEPEYLLAAWSLAHDRDLNLRNNLEEQSWKAFQDRLVCDVTHGDLNYFKRVSPFMEKADPEQWKNTQLLVHRPGTAVLLSPAAFSKTRMRWWAYFIIATLTSLGGLGILLLAFSQGIPPFKASLLSLAVILSPPSVLYANQAFPEIPAALLLTLSFLLCCSARFPLLLFSAFLLVMAPWFSDRAIPSVFLFSLFCLFQANTHKQRGILLVIFLAGILGLTHYYLKRFGVPWPLHHNPRVSPSLSFIMKGLPGFLLDRNRGILWLCPMLLFVPTALYSSFRQNKKAAVFLSLALGLSLLNIASFPDWMGGICPAGRYGVLFQILSLPAFFLWIKNNTPRTQKIVFSLLLFFGIIETLVLFNHPSWWFRKYHPLFAIPCLQPVYSLLPDLQKPDYTEIVKALLWTLVFSFTIFAASCSENLRKKILTTKCTDNLKKP
jgi:hypothetical protein